MEQTPFSSQAQQKKHSKALVIIPWIGLVLFVVLAAAGGYLYATKQLTLNTHSAGVANRATAVCGDVLINKYNAAMSFQERGNSTEATLDTAALNELKKDIPTKEGYATDPTCQTMLFWIAVQDVDAATAQTALTALNKLHDEGKYVDSNLANNAPLSTFPDTVRSLTIESQGQ